MEMKTWSTVIAAWNTALLVWLGLLVWLRSKQKTRANWAWLIPLGLASCSLNWLGPDFFSLAIVYVHPLIALWFLDRHLRRTRPAWSRTYRRCLVSVAVCAGGNDLAVVANCRRWRIDNGLFWRITQHSGAECCRRFRVTCSCQCICFWRCCTTLSGSSRCRCSLADL